MQQARRAKGKRRELPEVWKSTYSNDLQLPLEGRDHRDPPSALQLRRVLVAVQDEGETDTVE